MKALLIIDIQNDFLPGGSLAVQGGDQIIPVVNELIPYYDLVIATQDYHPANHKSFADNHPGKKVGDFINLDGIQQILWPTHCVESTIGAAFAADLKTEGIHKIFHKGTNPEIDSYSGFYDNGHQHATGLSDYLKREKVTELHIVGLATDYCVKFTILDALAEGFKVKVITDACRGVNLKPEDTQTAIDAMQAAGAEIIKSDQVLPETQTLYRPVGPNELEKLESADFKKWPPRLPEQPIFYPVLNQNYAEQIAKGWNVPDSGSGYVTRFEVKRSFLKQYPRKVVGGQVHEELWIPAEDLDELNKNIIGKIDIIKEFKRQPHFCSEGA